MEKIEEMILNARLKLGWIAELDESNTDIDDTSINEVEDKKIELSEKLANARILK